MSYYDQSSHQIKVEWGTRGAREAALRNDIIIVVDVLSFSSTVTTALFYKSNIYPFPPSRDEEALRYAESLQAELVVGRAEAIRSGGHSLSPVTFSESDNGKSFVLCSLNGAACVEAAKTAPALFVGSLLNAEAVAEAAFAIQNETGAAITIVPCGEKWENPESHENKMRPGIEDYLGAGAIISYLKGTRSPEAYVCEQAYLGSAEKITELISECGSGRELIERGFGDDVSHCAQMNAYGIVPQLIKGKFVPFDLPVHFGK